MRRQSGQRFTFLVFLIASVSSSPTHGQKRGGYEPPIVLNVLPSALTSHAEALGGRVLVPGKERTTFEGELVNEHGERRRMRVTVQLPSMVRIDGLSPDARAVVFDGSNATTTTRLEEQLIEIFSSDLAETMLASIRDGAAIHLLGRNIRSESADGHEATFYDIYEWAGAVPFRGMQQERLKRYSFDSATGLLALTEYLDESFSPPVKAETRFSNWRSVDGSVYPGVIDHLENGRSVFSWTAREVAALHRENSKTFNQQSEDGKKEER